MTAGGGFVTPDLDFWLAAVGTGHIIWEWIGERERL
jgi:hypothetical protein